MKLVTKRFDIAKWKSYSQAIIQPHIHELISQIVQDPNGCFYRGGFGRSEDFKRLLATGSDYEHATVTTLNGKCAAVYAAPFHKIGSEPWCKGLDPLYWALRGHRDESGWNPINCIVAYSLSQMDTYPGSDVVLFRSEVPSLESIEGILVLKFDKSLPHSCNLKKPVEVEVA